MKMRIILATAVIALLSGCVTDTPPLCYNTAKINKVIYDIPVFGVRKPLKTKEYLSGSAFGYQWIKQGNFVDTSECDKVPLTE